MNALKLLSAVVLALLVIPPVHADEPETKRPAWVDGRIEGKYAGMRFLTAIGSGETRRAAEQDARKALASIFRAQVQSETSTESSSTLQESTDASQAGESSSSTTSSVTVSTDIELRGLEVKRYYEDPKTGEHFAMAVIDKLKAKNSYNLELSKLRAEIQAKYQEYEKKPSMALAQAVLEGTEKYEQINRQFEVVNNGRGGPLPLSFSQLESLRTSVMSLRESNAIALEYSGPQPSLEFQEMITSCLSDKGIAVTVKIDEKQPPKYHVLYNVREKEKFMRVKGWVKYQFSSLAVIKKGKNMVARERISRIGTGRDKDMAFETVKEDLSEAVCSQIAKHVSL